MNLPASVTWLRRRAVVAEPAARAGWRWVAGLALAMAVTLGAVLLLGNTGLDGLLRAQPAALPEITFDRVAFATGEVTVSVRNTGAEAVEVSQVIVDDAYRAFTSDSGRRLDRLASARLRIPYPWLAGEPLSISVVDSTGATHTHDVAAAAESPVASRRTVAGYVLLGTYVGVIPVFLGLLFLPALARLGRNGLRFLLGLTGGLLIFLAVDALGESFELAGELAPAFHGPAVVFAGAVGTYAALAYLSRRSRRRDPGREAASPLALAFLVAVGIGLHNFGEGLAIGSAHARGDVALGTALVVGFALHNITEGIGIAAPTMPRLPDWRRLVALGAVAGLPTIVGTLLGGLGYSVVLGVLFLAVGVGAIAEVVDELARYARRRTGAPGVLLAGAAAGFTLMYATALMIRA